MARTNIDIGTLGNPATGDTLRTAMIKINNNFTEVYSLVRDGSSGLIATDVTNGDLKLQANGTGNIEIDQLSINGDSITSIVTNGSVDITGNGTGGVNIEALSFNGTSISSTDSSSINLNENVTVDGDLNVTGNITGTFSVSTVGDITAVGSTLTAPSNADLTLTTSGTGSVSIDGIQISGTEISSSDSTQITIKENLHVTGSITGDGSGLTGVVASSISSPATIDNITLDDNIISTSSNANLNLNPGGSGTVELQANTNIDGDATATTFIGALRGATVFQAKATEDISKGEAVYISGLSGNTPEVALARANSASTMPAFGIAESDIANTATGNIVTFGSCPGHDVSDFGETSITFALGDTVYISSAEAGKLTNVAPTGESSLIQNIGKIERATPTTNMTIKVGGAGRTNATPALDNGNIFIGNGSNQSSTVSLATQIKSYTGLTVVGDDSSGTGFNIGETIKVAGASGITTAVSGDTLTITGSGSGSTGDLAITGSTISTPSNADLTLSPGGTGSVQTPGVTITDNKITSNRSNDNLELNASGTGTIVLENLKVGTGATVTTILDEDNMSSDSATALATQQSIKAYVDSQAGTGGMTFSGNTMSTSSNADIEITPGGTGAVVLGDAIRIRDNHLEGTRSNEDVIIDPAGTGGIIAQGPVTFNAGYIEKINTLTSSSTITVNCATASVHKVTLATSTQFNIANLPTGGTVTLIITQDGSGSRTATFGTDGSSAVKFPSNSSTLSTGAADIDVVTIINDGTNFLGNIAKDYRSS